MISIIAISAVALLVVVALVPIKLTVVAASDSAPMVRLQGTWLFGAVRFCSAKVGEGDEGAKPTEAEGSSKVGARVLALLRSPGVIARTEKVAGDLLRCLRLRITYVSMELGLGDPADTGVAWAFVGPAALWLGRHCDGPVRALPNFAERMFVADCRAAAVVVPLRIVSLVLGYLTSRPILRGLVAAYRTGK